MLLTIRFLIGFSYSIDNLRLCSGTYMTQAVTEGICSGAGLPP